MPGIQTNPEEIRAEFRSLPLRELRMNPTAIRTNEVEILISKHPDHLIRANVPAATGEQMLAALNQSRHRNWEKFHESNLRKMLELENHLSTNQPEILDALRNEISRRI
jgi:hypothetical protein